MPATNLFFIDASVVDYQTLIDGLPAGSEWYLLDADADGITQMQAALASYSDLESIQIISHGAAGTLYLGNGVLDHASLSLYSRQLASLGSHLTETGDILLYGCNVAEGALGQQFVKALAQLTGADVAASTNLTGCTGLGGDWILESSVGAVSGSLMLSDPSYAHTLASMQGGPGNDLLQGSSGSDSIHGGDGNDQLLGQAGVDYLNGGPGDDLLDGGAGNDQLSGDTGSDTYVFARGYGQDTLNAASGGESDLDVILLRDLTAADVRLHREYQVYGNVQAIPTDDLLITIKATGDSLRVSGYFTALDPWGYARDRIQFSDGTSWGQAEIKAAVIQGSVDADVLVGYDTVNTLAGLDGKDFLWGRGGGDTLDGGSGDDDLQGDEGNDLLLGGTGNDTLHGGVGDDRLFGQAGFDLLLGGDGNDILDGGGDTNGIDGFVDSLMDNLYGGYGSDTYIFGRGYGFDTISNYAADDQTPDKLDVIRLTDLSAADISLHRLVDMGYGGDDLLITIKDSGDILRVFSHFSEGGAGRMGHAVDRIQFSDGTSWNYQQILANLDLNSSGTILGGVADDTLAGSAVDELLSGHMGNDNLNGGAGNDVLSGGDGNDTLDGGAGNDKLSGDAGSDTYLFGRGSGQDTIYAGDAVSATRETLRLKDLNATDITFRRVGDDLLLSVNDTYDNLRVGSFYQAPTSSNQIQRIEFADGSSWDDPASIIAPLVLAATADDDQLWGHSSNDSIAGGAGDDWIDAAAGNDVIDGGTGADTLLGGVGDDTLIGGSQSDTLSGGSGNDLLQGQDGNDQLQGEAGNDTLDGGAGIDRMYGGDGNDTYLFGRGGWQDIISTTDATVGKIDTLKLTNLNASGITLRREGDDLLLLVNGSNDSLRVSSHFHGDAAAGHQIDRIEFTDGSSWNQAAIKAQVLVATADDDSLWGYASNDTIAGGAGSDTLYGLDGNDTLNGGTGIDSMYGGNGDDTFHVDNADDVIVESSDATSGGTDTVQSSASYRLADHIENLVLVGSNAINATGNVLNNRLTGNAAANVIDGAQGADYMSGGHGSDTYFVENSNDVVVETDNSASTGGVDSVYSYLGSYTLGSNVENGYMLGSAPTTLAGNELDNILSGGTGADTLIGGNGNDTYHVNHASDVVSETSATGGTDTIVSSVSRTLGNYQENLTLSGAAAINGVGNALANRLTGNGAANVLNGGAGVDTMIGGNGNDTYHVDNASDVVSEISSAGGIDTIVATVTRTLGNYQEYLILSGAAAINGVGNTLANRLTGNDAANVLNGGAGVDTMIGGNGNDTYYVDNASDVVSETSATGGIDTIVATVTRTLGNYQEYLILSGAAAINGVGNTLANRLTGNDAANALNGGAGIDTMIGGNGNDTYHVDNASDVVSETSATGGIDTIVATVTRTLGNYQENLILSGAAAINGVGNTLANRLTGNDAANVLNGGAGIDTMIGGNGNDTYYVDHASDVVSEISSAGGIDTIVATVTRTLGNYQEYLILSGSAAINGVGNTLANRLTGNDAANVLNGGAGVDTLSGGAGNDRLVGGTGKDAMTGGTGNDIFDFDALSETGLTSTTWDVITDFIRGQDRIDLSTLDANTATTANDAFRSVIGSTTAFTAAGQLKVANGVLYGSTDADNSAEFAIQLTGITSLSTSDFIL